MRLPARVHDAEDRVDHELGVRSTACPVWTTICLARGLRTSQPFWSATLRRSPRCSEGCIAALIVSGDGSSVMIVTCDPTSRRRAVAASSRCCFRRGNERVVGRRLGNRCGRSGSAQTDRALTLLHHGGAGVRGVPSGAPVGRPTRAPRRGRPRRPFPGGRTLLPAVERLPRFWRRPRRARPRTPPWRRLAAREGRRARLCHRCRIGNIAPMTGVCLM